MSLDRLRVELLEAQFDGREDGRGAGDRDRGVGAESGVGDELGLQRGADILGEGLELVGARRIGAEVALAVADDADLERGVEGGLWP